MSTQEKKSGHTPDFIAHACGNHAQLLAALEELEAVQDLITRAANWSKSPLNAIDSERINNASLRAQKAIYDAKGIFGT